MAPLLEPAPGVQRLLDPRPGEGSLDWLGGDVASSAALAPDRYVWIFGDTLLGRARRDCPAAVVYCGRQLAAGDPDRTMIANSAGLMRFDAARGPAPLATSWRTIDGRPAPIFTPADSETKAFLWPLAVTRAGRPLLVAASVHTREMGLFSLGSVLLRVENPDDLPSRWRYTRHPLPNAIVATEGRPQLSWATALVVHDGYVHVVGEWGAGIGSQTVLARFAVAGIDDARWQPALEYLTDLGSGILAWRSAFDAERVHRVPGLPGTSEASFEQVGDGTWRTYRIPPGTFEIRLYVARALWGPWRDQGVVARIPAPWSTARRQDGAFRYAAYAVKAHPELGTPERPLLTYNVNVTDGSFRSAVSEAVRRPDFYVPRAVTTP